MARRPEQKLWDKLRANIPSEFCLTRIENAATTGMSDVVVFHKGKTFWIELKYAVVPKLEKTRLMGNGGLRTEQKNWHMLCERFRCKSLVLIKTDKGDVLVIEGRHALEMNEMSLTALKEIAVAKSIKFLFTYMEDAY